ncbi:hypothetical protein [Altererythrobacter sp. MF3-039]|uniref:hypothetical protein n=1 Tax=Altererythrobacter sp. MF3-039 TaxID=3252901 RepID=UPI00390C4A91
MLKPDELNAFRLNRAEHIRLREGTREVERVWRVSPGNAEVLEELERFGNGASLASCRRLGILTSNLPVGKSFCRGWTRAIAAHIAQEPLAQPQNAHQRSANASTMRIAQAGRAELSIVCQDVRGSQCTKVASVQFSDVESHDLVISGKARVLVARRAAFSSGSAIETREVSAEPGSSFRQMDGLVAKAFKQVTRPLLLLRLTRTGLSQRPIQQVALADGKILGQSSGGKHASCQEVTMAVLGRMRRVDAASVIEQIALGGSENLRWEAVRQCLALDVARGFSLLCDIATEAEDPLAGHAGTLRAQLLETHPQLAELERQECRV